MAAVVRVKRRLSEDPVDRLVIACKKQKSASNFDNQPEEPLVKEVFKFAGTIHKKDDGLRSHLKEAIRKERLTREYKVHVPADQKVSIRSTLVTHAKEGRFQLTLAHRAVDDTIGVTEGTDVPSAAAQVAAASDGQDQILCLYDAFIYEAASASFPGAAKPVLAERELSGLDVEYGLKGQKGSSEAAVTCNGLPMVKQKCEEQPSDADSAEGSEFVYDIYYTNKKGFDVSLFDSALQVEGFTDEFVYDRDAVDSSENYEDEDDSNDESNWRNDYPDEDPHYFDESGSEHEGEDSFDRDPLLEYFTSKCDLDAAVADGFADCDDDVNATAAVQSYIKHKQDLMRELEISGSEQSGSEIGDDT